MGWEIYAQLRRAGTETAYVDADQLGLCYPALPDDPDNHQIKARNLGAVWPTFQAAGARCLIMSGGVTTPDLVATYANEVPGTTLTLCRLRATDEELSSRFITRGWLPHLVDEAVREAAALDRSDFAHISVDTNGKSVPEVANLVRESTGGWPFLPSPTPDGSAP